MMAYRNLLLLWVGVNLLILVGCRSPMNSSRPTVDTAGSIIGKVATRATEAWIEVQRADGTSRMARVDQTGRYTIEGLTPGSYRLFATARGYSRSSLDAPIEVLAGQTTVAKEIILNWTGIGVPVGTLTGTVTDAATGRSVEGVYVQVACNPREIICLGRVAYTDVNGRYTIPSIPPGFVFDLYIARVGYSEQIMHGQVIGGNQIQTLDVRMGTP